MQKLLKRTAQVQRQAARRQRIARSENASDTRKILNQQQKLYNQDRKEVLLGARQALRESWALGPLAPRRDVGDKAETYGSVPIRLAQSVEKMDGKWKQWGIREGDRVCVTGAKEWEKGRIGRVTGVNQKAETCTVEAINKVNIPTPAYMQSQGQKEPLKTIEAPLPLSSVRLVTPLHDPATNTFRDVIVKELSFDPAGHRYISNYLDPESGKKHFIPYPPTKPPGAADADYEPQEDDTLRIDVEQTTFVPTLLRQPMPEGVIDELRNKYSKFRTRHEDSYIAFKKSRDEARRKEKEELEWGGGTPRSMLTPVQELNRMKRMERRGLEGDGLTEEVLARIGEVMVRRGARVPGMPSTPTPSSAPPPEEGFGEDMGIGVEEDADRGWDDAAKDHCTVSEEDAVRREEARP